MMLDDRLFEQAWIQELSNEDFRMLMYLFFYASKAGVVELNMRMLNFVANTGKQYTRDEVLDKFHRLVRLIPGKENTAIFPDWINVNWAKGKPIDAKHNPLFKSIANELSTLGLTFEDVSSMASTPIQIRESVPVAKEKVDEAESGAFAMPESGTVKYDDLFEQFWTAWPSECPRKVDKVKCRAKFKLIMRHGKNTVATFNEIMAGLAKWKVCDTWTKDGGAFIMAPLRWLNNANWKEMPGTVTRRTTNVPTNIHHGAGEVENVF